MRVVLVVVAVQPITNTDFITDTGPTSATKILNDMPIGNFYVAMTTGRGCSWSVTFTPR